MQLNEAVLSEFDFLDYVPWLKKVVFGNSLHAYVLTVLGFMVVWALFYGIRHYIFRLLARPADPKATEVRQFLQSLLRNIHPWVFPLIAFSIAAERLTIAPALNKGINLVTMAVVTYTVVRILGDLITFLITRTRISTHGNDPVVKSTNHNIATLVKVSVWAAGIMFFLDNAGFNVGTFVAGLGIGGIAIALAAQAILGDTFSSFAIALDKPFEVGDFIIVDDLQGHVEHIGLKTTRVRSLGGEMLVLANSDLTKSRLRNYKKMYRRRIVFTLGVVYDTTPEQLRRIQAIIIEAVKAQKNVEFDRAHFKSFDDWALTFETVYFVLKPEYNAYMDVQQEINLKIHAAFIAENLSMAFPTRTIIAQKE